MIPSAETTTSVGVVIDTLEIDAIKREIQSVRVARPSHGQATARVLLLPAGEGSNSRLGDGFALAVDWLRHSPVSVEVAYPDFNVPPGWFADRPEIASLPETAILELARHWRGAHSLPLYLMGFSKSGYAALSLLARHWRQQLFSGAAAWDAPLMLQEISSNSMLESYGSAGNFNAYRVDEKIPDLKAAVENHHARIVLCGFSVWGKQVRKYHRLLVESGVPHDYAEAKRSWHRWDESWMTTCLDAMLLPRGNTTGPVGGCPGLDRVVRGAGE